MGYVHLQKTTDAEETIEAKEAFEQMCETHNVKVLHYHADNGIFRCNKWKKAIKVGKQKLTFAGVNAHHQNGKAERQIREL